MENDDLNTIFKRFYHACGLINGNNIERERALIGIDNSFEHVVKYIFHINNVGFKVLLNRLISNSSINPIDYNKIKEFHKLRNKVYHEPGKNEIYESKLIEYRHIYEKCFSKIFNRHPLCLFLPWDEDYNKIKNFFRHWKMIIKGLYNLYITEFSKGGWPHSPNKLESWMGLAYYHGLIDDDDDFLIENTRKIITDLYNGNLVNNPKSYVLNREKALKELKEKIRIEIIYFYMYYDTRLR